MGSRAKMTKDDHWFRHGWMRFLVQQLPIVPIVLVLSFLKHYHCPRDGVSKPFAAGGKIQFMEE
jgi:hypothetical protein